MLAPALFCVAVDWILARFVSSTGLSLGTTQFTDLDYTDVTALFNACPSEWTEILTNFDSVAQTLGLHTSWSKIKVQNTSYRPPASPVQVLGNTVEATECFIYLGMPRIYVFGYAIDSSGCSGPDIHHRIGLPSSIMGRLSNIWLQYRLTLSTELSLYNVYIVSVLLRPACL